MVDEFETSEGRTAARDHLKSQFAGSQAASIKPNAIEALRKVSALLDAKAPEDAATFKAWLRVTAQRVAEAAKEGGFLGFGGVRSARPRRRP